MFDEYAVTYLNKLVDGIHAMGLPAIVHICGKMEAVKPSVAKLHGDALSVDAFVSLPAIKADYPQITTMGNLSTILLEFGEPEKVRSSTEALIGKGIDILAPACGLSTSTPLQNIAAFTACAKEA